MLVQSQAPNFTAQAVMPDNSIKEFDLYEYLGNDCGILFFYPMDFTFVCPTEIIEFNNKIPNFIEDNAKIIGVSVDSQYSHLAWKKMPIEKGGIGNLKYPLVSDLDKSISRAYEVLIDEAISLRGTFIIDKNKIIRSALVNDLPIGRNIDETLRTLHAMQFSHENNNVCPARWQKGSKGMAATSAGVIDYFSKKS